MAPPSQGFEPPANPARFTAPDFLRGVLASKLGGKASTKLGAPHPHELWETSTHDMVSLSRAIIVNFVEEIWLTKIWKFNLYSCTKNFVGHESLQILWRTRDGKLSIHLRLGIKMTR